jgi:hypothetical protein
MSKEAMKLALEASKDFCNEFALEEIRKILEEALAKQDQGEPIKLRRGNILRCIETDELCTVWSTSTTGKTLVKFGGNDFVDYTAEQIGELFWLEPESSDVEIAAEQSDNYAAFLAGVRFATAHTSKQEQGEPVAWMTQARCFVTASEFTEAEATLFGWKALYTTPQPKQEQGEPAPAQEPEMWNKPTDSMVEAATNEYDEWSKDNQGTTECIRSMLVMALKAAPQQRKPLTDEQKLTIAHRAANFDWVGKYLDVVEFVVEQCEAAHGIKE